ncbi:MAG TPA: NAD(P)/FAD-dependent oxidoreductase [candidate division Zixibacteria bacterium]|nr:NAD(P)/FAD-dependent oxidoreductase [candidate division Zixibacteria bacterium]
MSHEYDAVIIGSGPNGLAAAITMAMAELSVLVLEAKDTIGGGMRSAELTEPGFIHDICSAVHPLAAASPFLRRLPLEKHGLQWIYPPIAAAHPLENADTAALKQSIQTTAKALGEDREAYIRIFEPLVNDWEKIASDILGPLRIPYYIPEALRFGLKAIQSADSFVGRYFSNEKARALFAGMAAHSMLPLDKAITSAIALVLMIQGHSHGWPIPKGGSQSIANAMESMILSLGGKIERNIKLESPGEIPSSKAVLFDLTPKQILKIYNDALPDRYRRQLSKYRYGPGTFKIDWALSEAIPFKAEECREAGTLHVGGSFEEIAKSEEQVWHGIAPEKPYIILVQPSLFDSTRAPEGRHTAWAYCHLPNGSETDMTDRIQDQIERFAPGFKDTIIAKHTISPAAFESYNPNYIGGDINGGVQDLGQLFFRPVPSLSPYRMPLKGHYICSSSTPPGGGVHGMCGYHAARRALKDIFDIHFDISKT